MCVAKATVEMCCNVSGVFQKCFISTGFDIIYISSFFAVFLTVFVTRPQQRWSHDEGCPQLPTGVTGSQEQQERPAPPVSQSKTWPQAKRYELSLQVTFLKLFSLLWLISILLIFTSTTIITSFTILSLVGNSILCHPHHLNFLLSKNFLLRHLHKFGHQSPESQQ